MYKTLLTVFILIASITLPTSNALSAERTVRIGLFDHHPLIFLDNDIPSGFYIDLFKEIGEKNDWEIEYVTGSWAEGLARLKSGEIDLVTSIAYTEERDQWFDYTEESNASVWGQLYTREGSKINSLLDLNSKTVAIMKNDFNGQNLIDLCKKFDIDVEFESSTSFEDVLKKVATGEVDGGVTNNTYGYTHEKRYNVHRTPVIFSPFPLYFAVQNGQNRDLLATLDNELRTLKDKADSYYYKRLDFWFNRGPDTHFHIPLWVYYTISILLLISLAAFLLNSLLRKRVTEATSDLSQTNKELEKSIKEKSEAEERLQLHIYRTPLAVIEWNTNQQITAWNPAAEKIFGYSANEAIGQHASLITTDITEN